MNFPRVLGLDDSPQTFLGKRFDPKTYYMVRSKTFHPQKILIVGVIARPDRVEGIISFKIKQDGTDSTNEIAKAIKKTKFYTQIEAIMLQSVTMGGFNVVDISKLCKKLGIPVIALTRKKPREGMAEAALKKLGYKKQLSIIQKLGKPIKCGKLWAYMAGISPLESEKLVKQFSTASNLPEPIRLAHLIATGIVVGQSYGRA